MSKNIKKELCSHGCGQIGVKQQKEGKWICTDKTWHACPAHRKRMRKMKLELSPLRELRKNIANGTAKCYICGNRGRYIATNGKASCKPNAMDCSGYGEYIGEIHRISWKEGNRTQLWNGKGTRPEHSKALLKLNKFGKLGQYNFWHQKARNLYYTGICSICGKTKKEEHEYWSKDLTMHCKSDNWTDLSESNWTTICHVHHRYVHSKAYREEQAHG